MYCYHPRSLVLVLHRALGVVLALLISGVVGSTVCLATEEAARDPDAPDEATKEETPRADPEPGKKLRNLVKRVYQYLKTGKDFPREAEALATEIEDVLPTVKKIDSDEARVLEKILEYLKDKKPSPHEARGCAAMLEPWVTGKPPEPTPSQHLTFTTGAVILNPYKITEIDNKFTVVDTNEKDVEFFFEILFRDRAAWMAYDGDYDVGCPFLRHLDYEARAGYVHTKKGASASTVAGSGNTFLQLDFGPRLLKLPRSRDGQFQGSLNLEFEYTLVTDREAQDIHHTYGLGLVAVLGTPRKADVGRRTELLFGVYGASVEVPSYVDEKSLTVAKTRGEFACYESELDLMFRADVRIPVGSSSFLTFAGRYHTGHDLNPWTIWIGFTVPTEKILSFFK